MNPKSNEIPFFSLKQTFSVTQWLEHDANNDKVMGSIPGFAHAQKQINVSDIMK